MLIDIKILALLIFLKLNETCEFDKLHMNDLLLLNEIMSLEAKRLGINYECKINDNYYIDINYHSNHLLVCYEDENGYIIKLSKDADLNCLKEFIIEYYNEFNNIIEEVDLNYLFSLNKVSKRVK